MNNVQTNPKPQRGRKTKYRPELCEELVEQMKTGLSFEASCGALGISKDSGYSYLKKYPEFALAKSLGDTLGQHYWESQAIEHLWLPKDGGKFNSAVFSLTMKNRFGWREKKEISGSLGIGPSIDEMYKGFSIPQIDQEIEKILRRLAYSIGYQLSPIGKTK